MKRIILVTTFILMGSVQADHQPIPEKKEIPNEHRALIGLKATGAAVGSGLALYNAADLVLDIKKKVAGDRAVLSAIPCISADTAIVGFLYLYPAYTLGHKALTISGVLQANESDTSEENEVKKEHKVVSALKATGAAIGAGFGVLVASACLYSLCTSKKLHRFSVNHAIDVVCGVSVAYELGYKALPRYITRIRGK